MYHRIQEEAEDQGVSVSHFAREAVIVRATIFAHRRGMQWGADADWSEIAETVEEIDRRDARLRAESAKARRRSKPPAGKAGGSDGS